LRKKKFNFTVWFRKVHYWGAFIVSLPVIVIIISGILLQLKKDVSWIQPKTKVGSESNLPSITFDQILETAKKSNNAQINSWSDIDRLDVRIDKGIVKVKTKNSWEIQIDTDNAKILSEAYRRSDIIENFHDGSWFSDKVKKWIFLPSGIILLVLWLTGVYLVLFPYFRKWQKGKQQ
jgi:uncharacterized iron-regulated membrane protein